ncbi:MAG: hypothetical protein WCB93_02975 [Gallionella sp.]
MKYFKQMSSEKIWDHERQRCNRKLERAAWVVRREAAVDKLTQQLDRTIA